MEKKCLLLIEDDKSIREYIEFFLSRSLLGYELLSACDGKQGLEYIYRYKPALVVLDLHLPGGVDGFTVLRQMQYDERLAHIPVIVITADLDDARHVESLEYGAVDHLVKPFKLEVLIAHIKARLQRQASGEAGEILGYADVEINSLTHQAYRGPDELKLSGREFDLLDLFLRHPRQILSRDQIIEHVWGFDFEGETTNVVDVYIGYLRTKLEANGGKRLIQTIWGVGYVLREEFKPYVESETLGEEASS